MYNIVLFSDFSFEIHVSVVGLVPYETYELWAFFPDGEAIGGQRVRSNERGYLLNMQGEQDVLFRTHSSLPIPKGLYTLGIIRGEFTFNRKPYFTDWKESSNDKAYINFRIPYQNQLILEIGGIDKVPWGSHTVINGHASTKGHEPDASIVYQGKKINFIGSGPIPPAAIVDEIGNFTSVFKVEDEIMRDLNVQAIFDGDEHYSQSESNKVVYETVPHDTKLTIEIDPLRLTLPGTRRSKPQISLKPNEQYRISGLLLDSSFNVPIPSKRIFF
jgi:hypothetical protein